MAHCMLKELYTRVPAEDIADVTVNGWVRTMRESKNFAFVELNDGTYFRNLQVVLEESRLSDYRALVKRITLGAYFDHQVNTPLVSSTAYPTTNSNYGISVNMSLAK